LGNTHSTVTAKVVFKTGHHWRVGVCIAPSLQRLQRHHHQVCCGLCRAGVVRQHHGHRLTHMLHCGAGQQGHGNVVEQRPQRVHAWGRHVLHIAGLPHRYNAWQSQGRRCVDAQYLRMRMVAAHKSHMQRTGRGGIMHIKPQPSDQAFIVAHVHGSSKGNGCANTLQLPQAKAIWMDRTAMSSSQAKSTSAWASHMN